MRLRLWIHGVKEPRCSRYYDVRGDLYDLDGWDDEHDRPVELYHAPKVGEKISWQEQKNGPWETGRVTRVEQEIFYVQRFQI